MNSNPCLSSSQAVLFPDSINSQISKSSRRSTSSVSHPKSQQYANSASYHLRKYQGSKEFINRKTQKHKTKPVYYSKKSLITDTNAFSFNTTSVNRSQRLSSGSACDTCRKRKTKCDGNQPCVFCVSNSILCTHRANVKRKWTPSSTLGTTTRKLRFQSFVPVSSPKTDKLNRPRSLFDSNGSNKPLLLNFSISIDPLKRHCFSSASSSTSSTSSASSASSTSSASSSTSTLSIFSTSSTSSTSPQHPSYGILKHGMESFLEKNPEPVKTSSHSLPSSHQVPILGQDYLVFGLKKNSLSCEPSSHTSPIIVRPYSFTPPIQPISSIEDMSNQKDRVSNSGVVAIPSIMDQLSCITFSAATFAAVECNTSYPIYPLSGNVYSKIISRSRHSTFSMDVVTR
ncbi:hypothetical protein BDF14DRAFT_1877929 [Spinellus fusiger]|nr:hypothetical protein BDF14DRAFT_1877929 [Spinellus fusiger]